MTKKEFNDLCRTASSVKGIGSSFFVPVKDKEEYNNILSFYEDFEKKELTRITTPFGFCYLITN